jgi:hypothetical protein
MALGTGLLYGHQPPSIAHESGVRQRASRLARFAEIATVLMRWARRLYAKTPFKLGLEADRFALDLTLIELSLALWPWARWQREHASVKLNVLLDLREDTPVLAVFTTETTRGRLVGRDPVYPGSHYAIDRDCLHFLRLHRLHVEEAFVVTRLKAEIRYRVAESRPVDETVGLRCDQTIRLNSRRCRQQYPDSLRRISYVNRESVQPLVFLTNQFELPAMPTVQIYRCQWGIETFGRSLKQHLRPRGFFSTSPNRVRVQISSALCACLLVAIAKQKNHLAPIRWRSIVLTGQPWAINPHSPKSHKNLLMENRYKGVLVHEHPKRHDYGWHPSILSEAGP